jgi:hypothetical protein
MRTTDLTELLSTVEQIRSTAHPELGATFVRAVVEAEASHAEDESGALDAIRAAINEELDLQSGGSS